MGRWRTPGTIVLAAGLAAGCSEDVSGLDGTLGMDAGVIDGGPSDAGPRDAQPGPGPIPDSGPRNDCTPRDGGAPQTPNQTVTFVGTNAGSSPIYLAIEGASCSPTMIGRGPMFLPQGYADFPACTGAALPGGWVSRYQRVSPGEQFELTWSAQVFVESVRCFDCSERHPDLHYVTEVQHGTPLRAPSGAYRAVIGWMDQVPDHCNPGPQGRFFTCSGTPTFVDYGFHGSCQDVRFEGTQFDVPFELPASGDAVVDFTIP